MAASAILSEFTAMKELPIFYRGAHASAMADQVGVEWNGPIRLGGITVLPGDIIVADVEGVLAVPPQLVADVIKDAENTVYTENFKRELMRSKKYRARDIYPQAVAGAGETLRGVEEDPPDRRSETKRGRVTADSRIVCRTACSKQNSGGTCAAFSILDHAEPIIPGDSASAPLPSARYLPDVPLHARRAHGKPVHDSFDGVVRLP